MLNRHLCSKNCLQVAWRLVREGYDMFNFYDYTKIDLLNYRQVITFLFGRYFFILFLSIALRIILIKTPPIQMIRDVFSYIKSKFMKRDSSKKAKSYSCVAEAFLVDTLEDIRSEKNRVGAKYQYLVNGKVHYIDVYFITLETGRFDFPYKITVYYDSNNPEKAISEYELVVQPKWEPEEKKKNWRAILVKAFFYMSLRKL